MDSRADTKNATPGPGTLRSVVSLLLLVHLFFVAVALSGNYLASPIVARIMQRFAIYTQLLNLDTDFTPYYLTHASELDVDHSIEVELDNGESLRFPPEDSHGTLNYYRQQRLARAMAFIAENEAFVAELAGAAGGYARRISGQNPRQLRVRQHMLQDWEAIRGGTVAERDPDSEVYFRTPYAANFVITRGGKIRVVRIEETGQVAQPAVDAAPDGDTNGQPR